MYNIVKVCIYGFEKFKIMVVRLDLMMQKKWNTILILACFLWFWKTCKLALFDESKFLDQLGCKRYQMKRYLLGYKSYSYFVFLLLSALQKSYIRISINQLHYGTSLSNIGRLCNNCFKNTETIRWFIGIDNENLV